MSVEIAPLRGLSRDDVERLIFGYESPHRYRVSKTETRDRTQITLELVDLDEPYVKRWHLASHTDWYRGLLKEELSFGAYSDGALVGLAIVQGQRWNDTAMVWELHVDRSWQGRGIGRELLAHVEKAAVEANMRVVTIETQTTNVPAIGFYRAVGYAIDGVDLSYYSNDDPNFGEVALFMKKPLR